MNILVCKAATFGGGNYLLDRYYKWLKKNNYSVEQSILSENVFPPRIHYDIAVLPCYVMNDIYKLKKSGYSIDRMVLWIMGMGCFQDGYYNPAHTSGMKGFLTKVLKKEAENALRDVANANGICFTDVVGRYNTFREEKFSRADYEEENLIPIGISLKKVRGTEKREGCVKACWVGRVSYDFKYIPLIKALRDMDKYCEETDAQVEFTIVGDGNALQDVKDIAEKLSYPVEFIDFLPYEELDSFFAKQNLAFVMGTSALDAARNYCPAVVVTPVRPGIDDEKVFYRWIFESKGYSLGEYPGLDEKTGQVQKDFRTIMHEYIADREIPRKCYEYTWEYNEDEVFGKLYRRQLPQKIDKRLLKHIRRYYYLKKAIGVYVKVKNRVHLSGRKNLCEVNR